VRDPLPQARRRARLTGRARVVAVGNRWRRDDGAGLEVARRLRGVLPAGVELLEQEGEPADLVDTLTGAGAAWVVDAVCSGARPGTVHRVDAGLTELPAEVFHASTHAMGLAEAVELARALRRLPPRVVVYGIEGGTFAAGEGLSPAVEAAAARVAAAIREEVEACTSGR